MRRFTDALHSRKIHGPCTTFAKDPHQKSSVQTECKPPLSSPTIASCRLERPRNRVRVDLFESRRRTRARGGCRGGPAWHRSLSWIDAEWAEVATRGNASACVCRHALASRRDARAALLSPPSRSARVAIWVMAERGARPARGWRADGFARILTRTVRRSTAAERAAATAAAAAAAVAAAAAATVTL